MWKSRLKACVNGPLRRQLNEIQSLPLPRHGEVIWGELYGKERGMCAARNKRCRQASKQATNRLQNIATAVLKEEESLCKRSWVLDGYNDPTTYATTGLFLARKLSAHAISCGQWIDGALQRQVRLSYKIGSLTKFQIRFLSLVFSQMVHFFNLHRPLIHL